MTELPPLKTDGEYFIDEIIPGYVIAHSGIQAGEPTIPNTRTPILDAAWIWKYRDRPTLAEDLPGITRDQILVAYGFQKGVEWQRSRKRRNRIWNAVMELFREHPEEV